MSSDDVQTNIRLPAALKERLTASAAASNRSLSAEVASRLESSYAGPSEPYATKSQLERVFSRISRDHDQAMMAVSLVRDMLGSYVQRLYGRLSAKDKAAPEFLNMLAMAEASIRYDEQSLARAIEASMEVPAELSEDGWKTFASETAQMNRIASERRRKLIDGEASNDATPGAVLDK